MMTSEPSSGLVITKDLFWSDFKVQKYSLLHLDSEYEIGVPACEWLKSFNFTLRSPQHG